MGVGSQVEPAELEEVAERFVKTCPGSTFQDDVHIQVIDHAQHP